MKVVIMAGGEGTRLRPLTCNIPKPMVPVVNKPIMQHIIELIKKQGINDIAVTLQYMPEVIKDYFGDGQEFGVNLKYYIEDTPLGTAGSVKNTEEFLDDTFIVISGDALTDINLKDAIEFHKKNKSIATLVLTKVDVPLEYGVVVTDESGKITRFLEKPSWGEVFSDTVNTGIYILEPEVLKMINKNQVFDFSKDLFPTILKQKLPLYGYITNNYWCDIGDLKAYHQAHIDFFEGRVNIEIDGNESKNKVWVSGGSQISSDCVINGPIVIGRNVKIKSGAVLDSYCVIGDGTIIDEDSSIKRSICWKNCFIGKKTELRGTILCNKTHILQGAALFEHSVIGNSTTIGEHAVIKPSVKIWPNKTIDSGTEVNSNLVWANKFSKSFFGARGIGGEINLDITPEFSSRLGAAYGATFKKTPKIGISFDGKSSSYIIYSSMISGLMSSGVKVYQFGALLLPMMRTASKFYGLDGGIYVASPTNDSCKMSIDFMDSNGCNISRGLERSIENILIREDFARCKASDIQLYDNINNFDSFYTRSVINKVKSRPINLKVLISVESELVKTTLVNLLKESGCQVEYANLKPTNFRGKHEFNMANEILYLKNYVTLSNSDIGVLLDNSCEKMILIDEIGRVIKEDLYLAIISLILFSKHRGSTAVVPISASNVIEKIASKYEGKTLRTKTSVQEIMNGLNTIDAREINEEQFAYHFDALESLMQILDYMALNKLKLSDIVNMIPDFHVSKKVVECPWEMKGKVMRSLIEEKQNDKVELFEGVKVIKDDGWVLVLPDAEQPLCNVIGEGLTEEIANELTDLYVEKIKGLRNN